MESFVAACQKRRSVLRCEVDRGNWSVSKRVVADLRGELVRLSVCLSICLSPILLRLCSPTQTTSPKTRRIAVSWLGDLAFRAAERLDRRFDPWATITLAAVQASKKSMRCDMQWSRPRSGQNRPSAWEPVSTHAVTRLLVCRFNVTLIPTPFSGMGLRNRRAVLRMCSGSSVRDTACTE